MKVLSSESQVGQMPPEVTSMYSTPVLEKWLIRSAGRWALLAVKKLRNAAATAGVACETSAMSG